MQEDIRQQLRRPQPSGRRHNEDLTAPGRPDDIWARAGEQMLLWHIRLNKKLVIEESLGNIATWLIRHYVFDVDPSGQQTIALSKEGEIIIPNEYTILRLTEIIVKREIR